MPQAELPGQVSAAGSTSGNSPRPAGTSGNVDSNGFMGVCVDDQTSAGNVSSKKRSSANEAVKGSGANGHTSKPSGDWQRQRSSTTSDGASSQWASGSVHTGESHEVAAWTKQVSERMSSSCRSSATSFASFGEEDERKTQKSLNILRKLSRKSMKVTNLLKRNRASAESHHAPESSSRFMVRSQTQKSTSLKKKTSKNVGFDVTESQELQQMAAENDKPADKLKRSNSFAERASEKTSNIKKRMSAMVSTVVDLRLAKPKLKRQQTLDFRQKLTRTNCAMVFGIRSERGNVKEQLSELQHMLHVFGQSDWRLSLVEPWGVRYQIALKCLTFYTLMFAPLQLAVESTCTGNERSWFAFLKSLQFACSLFYAAGALPARFIFSMVDLHYAVELYDLTDLIRHHLRRPEFWLDLVSAASLPFEIHHLTQEPTYPSMTQVLIAVLTMCRSWRFLSDTLCVGNKGRTWRRRLYLEVFAKFGNLVLFLHFFACTWALLGVSQVHSNYPGWRDGMKTGCMELYTESVYFMTTTVTSVGYGDVLAANALERLMCVVMMIVGQMLCAEILAHINWVTSTANFAQAEHISKVTKTCASLESLRVSPAISARVLAFLNYARINRNSMALLEQLEDLSYPLRTELLLTTYYDLVIACPFFKQQPFEVILFVVHSLQDHAYLPGDLIYREGTVATELLFIRTGEVAILAKAPRLICNGLHACLDDEVSRLRAGDYFGEMCAVAGSRHTTTAVTASYAVLSVLPLDAIQVLERLHPEGFLVLVRTAQQMNNTRVTTSWAQVWAILNERFDSHEEAFAWIADTDDDDMGILGISGVQFVDGLSKLGVPRFDAQVLWANAEAEKTNPEAMGLMTCEEFCQHAEEALASDSVADSAELAVPGSADSVSRSDKSGVAITGVAAAAYKPKFDVDPAVIKRDFEQVQAELKKVFIATGIGQRPSLLSDFGLLYQRVLRQLAVVTVLIAPWQLGFEASCQEQEHGIALALKIILLVCSLLYTLLALPGRCFFSVTKVELGIELQGLEDIIAHELASWRCWLDIIAALSLPLEAYQFSQQPTSPTWVHGLVLVSVLRSWRILQPSLAFHSRVQVTKEALWLFWLLLLQIHIFACAWGLIGVLQWHARKRGHPMQEEDWVTDLTSRESLLFSENPGCAELYILSLYYAGATVTAVGYGDIVALNPIEHIVAVTTMLAGQMFIAEVFAHLNWSTSTNRQINAEHISKVSHISAALDNLQVPKLLRERVLALTEYAQVCQQEKVILPVVEELSPPLQLMVRSSLYSNLMRGCPFFRSIEQDTIDLVIKSLEDVAYLPNDFVFREGDMGDDMYFIRTGEVRLIKRTNTDKEWTIESLNYAREIKRLKPGAYFGELAALMGGARRKLCAVSTGYSILSVLNADAFKILEQEHPAPFVTLARAAQELLKTQQKPTWSWVDAAETIMARFQKLEDAFDWIQGDSSTVDIITIANFTAAFSKLGVDRFNAHALWMEADKESKGVIQYSDFQTIICANSPHRRDSAINFPQANNMRKLSGISGKNVMGQERLGQERLADCRSNRASFGTTNIVVTTKSSARGSFSSCNAPVASARVSLTEGNRVSAIGNLTSPIPCLNFDGDQSGISRRSSRVSILGARPSFKNGASPLLGSAGGRNTSMLNPRASTLLDPKLSRLTTLMSPRGSFVERDVGSVLGHRASSLLDPSMMDPKLSRLTKLTFGLQGLSPRDSVMNRELSGPSQGLGRATSPLSHRQSPVAGDDPAPDTGAIGFGLSPRASPVASPRHSKLMLASPVASPRHSTLMVPTESNLMVPSDTGSSVQCAISSTGAAEAGSKDDPKTILLRASSVSVMMPSRLSNVGLKAQQSTTQLGKVTRSVGATLASIQLGLGKSQNLDKVDTKSSAVRHFLQRFTQVITDFSDYAHSSSQSLSMTMLRSDGGSLFELRMPCSAREQEQQLDQMLYTESGQRRRYSLVGHRGRLYQRVLRLLAAITLLLAPWELAVEPASHSSERDFVLMLKVVQLITSVVYCVLALPGRMLFTVCDLTHCSEVHETGAVLRHLVRTHGFHLDVVALIGIPFECAHLWEEPIGTPTVSQVLMTLALLRAWRIFIPDVSIAHARTPIFLEVFWLLSILLMEIHLIACAWALLGLMEGNAGVPWWLHSLDMTEPTGCVGLYIQSIYFVGYTVTGVGYGNLLPVNAFERCMSVVIMIAGQMSIAEVFARLNWMTAMYSSIRAEHASRVRQLTEAMEQLQVDQQLEQRVIAYTEYCHLYMKESSVRRYFEDLSPPLLSELRLAVNHELVISCPFFQNQPLMVVCLIVNLLREQAYLPYDFIFRQGEAASDLYMIRGGNVSMLVVNTESTVFVDDLESIEIISELTPGNYFGEVGVLTGRPHQLSAMAQTYCILSLLSNSAFDVLEAEYAGCLLHLMRAAGEWIPELQNGAFSWQELADTLIKRFDNIDDAFYWLSGESVTNILSLTSFKESLEPFGIPRHGALSLWANSGLDDACTMDLETFRDLLIESASAAVKEERGLRSKRECEAAAAAGNAVAPACQTGQMSSQKADLSKVAELQIKLSLNATLRRHSSDDAMSSPEFTPPGVRRTAIEEEEEGLDKQASTCVEKQTSLCFDKQASASSTVFNKQASTSVVKHVSSAGGFSKSDPVRKWRRKSQQESECELPPSKSSSETCMTHHKKRNSLGSLASHKASLPSLKSTLQKLLPSRSYLSVLSSVKYENVMRVKQSDGEQDRSLGRVLWPHGRGHRMSLTSTTGILYQKVLRFLSVSLVILVAFRFALMSTCRDFEHLWVRALEIAYYACSGTFLLVALPGRFLFTVIDIRKGEEWFDFMHVSLVLLCSPGLWLAIASGTGFSLEYLLWRQGMEYTAPWCQMVVGLRLLGGWHALQPIQRTGTGQTQLMREVIRLLIVLFVMVHLLACSWSHFAVLESQVGQSNWIDNEPTGSCFELYAASFYFTAFTITATGYGDILPANDLEMVLSVAIMIAGTFLIATIFASLNRATTMHNFRRAQQISKVSHTAAALENLGVHAMFSSRVFALREYISLSHKDNTLLEYVEDLSPPLRAELRTSRYDGLLRKCPFFVSVPQEVLHLVINRLKDQVYLPQDFVFRAGDPSDEMFFIRWGQLTVLPKHFDNSKSFESVLAVKQLHLGDYFGEIGVLTQEKRSTYCLADEYCVLSTLDYTVFEDLQQVHPHFFLSLIRSVQLPHDSMQTYSWIQVSKLLMEHFGDIDTAFTYACLKAGLIASQDQAIPVSVLLGIFNRLGITTFQAQLLWAGLDFAPDSDVTVVSYADFRKYCGCAGSAEDVA